MTPRQLAKGNLLFVDDLQEHLAPAAAICRTHRVAGAEGMGEADFLALYTAAGVADAMLRAAAEDAKRLFLKPYGPPPDGASSALKGAWRVEHGASCGVQRPNHALANGLRKALLVPHVVDAYAQSYAGNSYGKKAAFAALKTR